MNKGSFYYCGIDIGMVNTGITFISNERIIGYRGSTSEMTRYEVGQNLAIYKVENKNEKYYYKDLCELIMRIPEFEKTERIRIEKQVPFHDSEVLRVDGVLYGFLRGRFPNIDIEYESPATRTNFCKKLIEKNKELEFFVKVPSKIENNKSKETKIPAIIVVGIFFPEYYDFIYENVEDDKLDDLCDSLIYAAMGTNLLPNDK